MPESQQKPYILILISIMCVISFYVVMQPLKGAPQQKTQSVQIQAPEIKYDSTLGYKVVNKLSRNLSELFYTFFFALFSSIHIRQGFKFKNSTLIAESAGLYGESEIHYLDTKSLQIVQRAKMDSKYFGEGCAFFTNSKNEQEIHQLTWRERKVVIYNSNDLSQKRVVELPQQMASGWGLATLEGQKPGESQFLATDGSNYIFFIQPETWTVNKAFQIYDQNKKPLTMLNELEIVGDKILANVYLSTKIVELELETGKFIREYDFTQLKNEVYNTEYFIKNRLDNQYCLNGIAYDKETKKMMITGKKWPFIYEIQFDNLN